MYINEQSILLFFDIQTGILTENLATDVKNYKFVFSQVFCGNFEHSELVQH